MGWYGTSCTSKADLIAYLTEPFSSTQPNGTPTSSTTVAKAVYGSTLWAVREQTIGDAKTRYIIAYTHLACVDHEWGYKPVSEDMGPVELGCPLAFFDLVPEAPNEWAREFRARTRAYARRAENTRKDYRNLAAGDRLEIGDSVYTVLSAQSTKPTSNAKRRVFRVLARSAMDGITYRLRAGDVGRATRLLRESAGA